MLYTILAPKVKFILGGVLFPPLSKDRGFHSTITDETYKSKPIMKNNISYIGHDLRRIGYNNYTPALLECQIKNTENVDSGVFCEEKFDTSIKLSTFFTNQRF